MKIEQIYSIANDMTKEYVGSEAVLNEDLSNIVDIGEKTFGINNMDHYVRTLIDKIGRVTFVDRPYTGATPSLYMTGWEYGAVEQKVTYDTIPEAEENETWKLTDGTSYDPNIFTQPKVSAKFYSKKVTFDIPMSFAERQVKSAFRSAQELNSFFSMIETAIETSTTVKMDSLAMRTVNYMMALAINGTSKLKKVNLLQLYKAATGATLTAAKCLTSPEFIRYAAFTMGLYESRLHRLSTLFNSTGKDRFTPSDRLNVILLADFAKAADVYLQSDTFHNDFVKLPKADLVPYWQGSGTEYDFASVSKINVKVTETSTNAQGQQVSTQVTVNQDGILGCMFDRFACGVANLDRRVTANWNGRAEFFNNWYKFDAGYFSDPDENFVVFYVSDSASTVAE